MEKFNQLLKGAKKQKESETMPRQGELSNLLLNDNY